MWNGIRVGARWDDASQNSRFLKAQSLGIIDYMEVNYPISPIEDPSELNLPILAHTSNNPLCSAHGIDLQVANRVRDGAHSSDSPWVGEHLAFLGSDPTGALGYVINPLFTVEFAAIAIKNALTLHSLYGRPIALELGPLYTTPNGDFRSELDFIGVIAEESDSLIILDLTHWTVSNKNLRRDTLFGLNHLPLHRVVEIHVAGIRKSANQDVWHDAHGELVDESIFELLSNLIPKIPNLKAITLEQSMERSEEDFIAALKRLALIIER